MSESREEQPLSGKELEPAFGPQMPAPHTLVGILRQHLEELVIFLREERGEVHVREDVYGSVLRLGALVEGLQDYAAAFKKIATEAKGYIQDDLELAVGEQDGIPLSGMKVPDPDGTDINVALDTSGEYSFDLEAIMTGVAHQVATTNPVAQLLTAVLDEDKPHVADMLVELLVAAMTALAAAGQYRPQVTKVRALATEIARTDPKVAGTITSTIKRTTVFKGIKIKREQPK